MTEIKKILVVEDNDFVRMQIVQFLKNENYEVDEASNGEVALKKIRDNFALAIVDVRMEPMGGFEFIRHLRANNLDTPVVLVTGDQSPDLLSEAAKLEVTAVLLKPVQRDRLIKAVARTLQLKDRAS
ncbi:MAG: response regulator [Alphaproteobacteria bacterium]